MYEILIHTLVHVGNFREGSRPVDRTHLRQRAFADSATTA